MGISFTKYYLGNEMIYELLDYMTYLFLQLKDGIHTVFNRQFQKLRSA